MRVAEEDAGQQLAQHRRLSRALGQIAAELRCREEQREGEQHGGQRVAVALGETLHQGLGHRDQRRATAPLANSWRTRATSSSGANGFWMNGAVGGSRLRASTSSPVYPDMKRTGTPG